MKIKFLGTSAGEGYPGHFCNCIHCTYARVQGGRNIRSNSSAIIDGCVLLDMNVSTFYNAPRFGVSLGDVHTALITHPHEDHLYLDNLEWRFRGRPELKDLSKEELIKFGCAPRFTPMEFLTIFGNGYTEEAFRHYQPLMEQGEMAFVRFENDETFEHKGYKVTAVRANHVKPGYSTSYIVEKKGKTLLYAADTGGYDEDMKELLKAHQYDLIVMEGTGGLSDCGTGHCSLQKNILWRNFFLTNRCIEEGTPFVITHMSPHWTPPYDQYVPIAQKEGMIVAYDGYEIEV